MSESDSPEASLESQRKRRIPVLIAAHISTIDPETDPVSGEPCFHSSQESVANLSYGGAFVETPEILPLGRRLLVELELPEGKRVEAIGRVAWTRARVTPQGIAPGAGFGIEFVGAAPEHFEQLEAFLRRAGERLSGTLRTKTQPQPPSTSSTSA